jgi:hypothetical protein
MGLASGRRRDVQHGFPGKAPVEELLRTSAISVQLPSPAPTGAPRNGVSCTFMAQFRTGQRQVTIQL